MQNCRIQEWIVEQFRMETKFASMAANLLLLV